MSLGVSRIRFKNIPEVFSYQPQILGDIDQHFCSLDQDISNWPEVVPIRLNSM